MFNPLHKQLLNDYQRDFPITERPYLAIAHVLGVTEDDVITALRELKEQNCISRIGPVFPPNRLGKSTLVAMAVPAEHLRKVADVISAFPEVNHNYEREHRFNLWFVLAASDEIRLQGVISRIEKQTGYRTMQLPLIEEFFIDLSFELKLDHD